MDLGGISWHIGCRNHIWPLANPDLKKQLVWQGSRVLNLTERRPERPRDDVKPGSEETYVMVIPTVGLCRLNPENSPLVRPERLIH